MTNSTKDTQSSEAPKQEELVGFRAYEWATERLERDYKRLALAIGTAAVVATVGGLLTLPRFVSNNVSVAVSSAVAADRASFENLKTTALRNLADANLAVAELDLQAAQLATKNSTLNSQLDAIKSSVQAIDSEKYTDLAERLQAAKELPANQSELLQLLQETKELRSRVPYTQNACSEIPFSNCNNQGWLECPNGTFLAGVRNAGGSNTCTSMIKCCK
jgi:hypothetical protein